MLNCFLDVSKEFREELFYKLKNGKLGQIIGEGASTTMNGNGYEEAHQFYNEMRDKLREIGRQWDVEPDRMVGLWNMAVQIDVTGKTGEEPLIWRHQAKVYSTKPYNVYFRLKAFLQAAVETGMRLTSSDGQNQTILKGLYILCLLLQASTIELSEDQAKLLAACHKRNAYESGIEENGLLESLSISRKTVDELVCLHCIRLDEGKIYLAERVII